MENNYEKMDDEKKCQKNMPIGLRITSKIS